MLQYHVIYHSFCKLYTRSLSITHNPLNHADILVNRSRCHMMLGNLRQSLLDAETAMSIVSSPKSTTYIRGLFQKAEALYAAGNFEDALVLYHRGKKSRPELQGFAVGVSKCIESIRSAVALIDADKLREERKKEKDRKEIEEEVKKRATELKKTRGGGRLGGAFEAGLGEPKYSKGLPKTSVTTKSKSGAAVKPVATGTNAGGLVPLQPKHINEKNLIDELYDDKLFLEDVNMIILCIKFPKILFFIYCYE